MLGAGPLVERPAHGIDMHMPGKEHVGPAVIAEERDDPAPAA